MRSRYVINHMYILFLHSDSKDVFTSSSRCLCSVTICLSCYSCYNSCIICSSCTSTAIDSHAACSNNHNCCTVSIHLFLFELLLNVCIFFTLDYFMFYYKQFYQYKNLPTMNSNGRCIFSIFKCYVLVCITSASCNGSVLCTLSGDVALAWVAQQCNLYFPWLMRQLPLIIED